MSAADASSDLLQLVTFRLGGGTYGVDIRAVREIIRPTTVTRMPGSPSFVEGIINLRGRVVPVVDLRRRFKLSMDSDPRSVRVLIVELGLDAAMVVGFVVDAVAEVLRIPPSVVSAPPATCSAADADADCVDGIARLDDRLVILVTPGRLLRGGELKQLGDMGGAGGPTGQGGPGRRAA